LHRYTFALEPPAKEKEKPLAKAKEKPLAKAKEKLLAKAKEKAAAARAAENSTSICSGS